jgi:hypothetical protein
MGTAHAQVGLIDQDLIFVPITPCRIFDTRISEGGTGPIFANAVKHFVVKKTDSFAAQGGNGSNCGLGAASLNNNFAAAAINLTAISGTFNVPGVNVSAYSWITAYPFGSTKPLASTLNFGATLYDIRTVATVVKVNTDPAASLHLSIHATAQTEVIGDLVGYYSSPRATVLNCTNPPVNTLVVAPGAIGRAPIPACVYNGGGSSTGYCTSDGQNMASYAGTTGLSECVMKNLGTVDATITAGRRCCGVPGQRPYF